MLNQWLVPASCIFFSRWKGIRVRWLWVQKGYEPLFTATNNPCAVPLSQITPSGRDTSVSSVPVPLLYVVGVTNSYSRQHPSTKATFRNWWGHAVHHWVRASICGTSMVRSLANALHRRGNYWCPSQVRHTMQVAPIDTTTNNNNHRKWQFLTWLATS